MSQSQLMELKNCYLLWIHTNHVVPTTYQLDCCDEIAPVLAVIFTQSLNLGNLPKDWLTANVTPIFKKGDRANPSNYQPISLTSICIRTHSLPLYNGTFNQLSNT